MHLWMGHTAEDEIVANYVPLLLAGHETTAADEGFCALLDHSPDLRPAYDVLV
ncbi:hypothetical protein [Saccharothrix texasensis]|uniref:hypothetical protein n=1 Tax=Saccharothrix texasensis TaxID=103734 RepID=UPI001476AFAF|nr:hypothetical protein [Saccharothrix texasensis]